MKAEKSSHFEEIEVKVFEATFEKKNYALIYVYQWINDGSKSVFDADQHAVVHLAGNDYSFALICKEGTDILWTSSDIFDCN